MKKIEVIKQSGESEGFDEKKFLRSLKNAGVTPRTAEDVLKKISPKLKTDMRTEELFKITRGELRSCDVPSRMRYGLKKAIYALGPSGYPFEKYVARVLKSMGYEVKVGVIVRGKCVKHEVDVVAKRSGQVCMVECKFHTSGGVNSNVKTALYVHSRFQDIKRAHAGSPLGRISMGMLVTNTRFTSDAIKFAKCVGIQTMGWKHPKGHSLEKAIDRSRVYPITVLPSVNPRVFDALVRNDIILAQDIDDMNYWQLSRVTGIDQATAKRLVSQSRGVCGT